MSGGLYDCSLCCEKTVNEDGICYLCSMQEIGYGSTADTGGVKFDDGKPMMGLIPPEALTEVAKVLTYGAQKYAAHNWRKGMKWSRPLDACYRHLNQWQRGISIDAESGERHLAHAIVNLMFILTYELTQGGEDDRHK